MEWGTANPTPWLASPIGSERDSTVGAWRIARAILPLPFTATVVVPAVLLLAGGGQSRWEGGALIDVLAVLVGGALILAGLALFVSTVRLFAGAGQGTLAPWDPPTKLVVAGPYRHLRHPMITGVACVLAGEALVFGSTGLATWLAIFVAVNAIYLPAVEEPRLVRRFGEDYRQYMKRVPRWLPRRSRAVSRIP